MPNKAEYDLASSVLPRVANRIRRRVGDSAFRLLLYYIEGDFPSIKVARMFGLRNWEVVIWRQVLTAPSRKLIPGIAALKATSPLLLVQKNEGRESA
jgi:hypothetical protein